MVVHLVRCRFDLLFRHIDEFDKKTVDELYAQEVVLGATLEFVDPPKDWVRNEDVFADCVRRLAHFVGLVYYPGAGTVIQEFSDEVHRLMRANAWLTYADYRGIMEEFFRLLTRDISRQVERVNDEVGIRWGVSFLGGGPLGYCLLHDLGLSPVPGTNETFMKDPLRPSLYKPLLERCLYVVRAKVCRALDVAGAALVARTRQCHAQQVAPRPGQDTAEGIFGSDAYSSTIVSAAHGGRGDAVERNGVCAYAVTASGGSGEAAPLIDAHASVVIASGGSGEAADCTNAHASELTASGGSCEAAPLIDVNASL